MPRLQTGSGRTQEARKERGCTEAEKAKGKEMRILGYIVMSLGGLWILYIRFANIDETETRLFIDNFVGLLLAVVLLVGGYYISEYKK